MLIGATIRLTNLECRPPRATRRDTGLGGQHPQVWASAEAGYALWFSRIHPALAYRPEIDLRDSSSFKSLAHLQISGSFLGTWVFLFYQGGQDGFP